MAQDVIEDKEGIKCPHCHKHIVLRLSTNVYELGEYGKPSISVDKEDSKNTEEWSKKKSIFNPITKNRHPIEITERNGREVKGMFNKR